MSDSENEEVLDLASPDVTTKYMTASTICNAALTKVVEAVKAGMDVVELCALGDAYIEQETGKLYNKKEKGRTITKGVAFPTCVSVNEIGAHFSPLAKESMVLKDGDVVKIDLGAHIDGFIAVAAHTVIIGACEGRKADVVLAAWNAAEAALRTVQVGKKNGDVTAIMNKAAGEFKCNMVQGTLSHQMKQHVIDGNQCIIAKETAEERVEEFEFGLNEVYAIDVLVSTGEGRAKEAENRTTVYKRAVEMSYQLKTQKARQFISEVNRRFPSLPFTLRAISDEQICKIGVSEATRHELLDVYPVLTEKKGEYVAQFKFTVLLLPGGTKRVTGLPLTQEMKSEFKVVDEDLAKLLATSANPKKKKKNAKKENAAAN